MDFSMSQIVQVVSIELVPMRLLSYGFQSKDVRGAENHYPILSNSYIFKVELKTDLLVVLDLPYPKALS